jgi:predicted PurR-regulated permease PerM
MSSNISSYATSQLDGTQTTLQNIIDTQNQSMTEIQAKNEQLAQKKLRQIEQIKEIEEKQKLVLTRSRMLQIAQERNNYKKKIIYSLIAAILAIFIITIFIYVFFTRRMKNTNVINSNRT